MIDIVIPTINLKYTDICLKSLRKRTKREDYRLILVHDQATQEDHDYIDKVDADVKIYNDIFQAGVSKVWNQGLAHIKNDYVLIANNDILFFDGWLSKLEKYAREHQEIGMLSAWSHWIGEIPLTDDGEEKANHQLKDYSDKNEDKLQLGMQGCFFLLRKDVIEKVGNFDERFFPYCWEDGDYCRRVRMAGYQAQVWHGCSLYHWGGRTVGDPKFAPNSHNNTMINRVKYYEKWGILDQINKTWMFNSGILYIEDKEHAV